MTNKKNIDKHILICHVANAVVGYETSEGQIFRLISQGKQVGQRSSQEAEALATCMLAGLIVETLMYVAFFLR